MQNIIRTGQNMPAVAGHFPSYIWFAFPSVPGVSCVFSTGMAGNLSLEAVSNESELNQVIAKRKHLASSCGFSTWTEAKQVHSKRILLHAEKTALDKPPQIEADGASTSVQGHALAIKTADCQPVLLAHRSGEHVAALHVGWRGNANDFIVSAVDEFCQGHSILSKDIFAMRGPSLGSAVAEFVNFDTEWPEKFHPWYDKEQKLVDLWSLSRDQLRQAGVPNNQILGLDLCTATLSPLFFSHRRGQGGRQLSLIWRNH